MKYRGMVYSDDKDIMEIHVDQRLIRGSMISIDLTDDAETVREEIRAEAMIPEGLVGFYNLVTELPGIQHEIIFERYCISLKKGSLFEWKNLLAGIMSAMQFFVAKDCHIEAFDRPRKARKRKKARQTRAVQKHVRK